MNSGVLLEILNMGGSEVMVILIVILLLFGGKKLPELARGLGKGIRDFKDASEGVKREIHRNMNAVMEDEAPVTSNNNRHHPVSTENENEQNESAPHDPTAEQSENHTSPEEVIIDTVEKSNPEESKS